MNSDSVNKIAFREMPSVDVETVHGSSRQDVIAKLERHDNIGIELGVARGVFSERMMASGKFRRFYGVDRYGDIHDVQEYKLALKHVGLEKNYHLLRMTFEEAIDLFDDEYFDFVYIDGFAHTGEDGGRSIIDWYRKVKVGGVLAGDDYHRDWPLVMWAVNHFVVESGHRLYLTEVLDEDAYSLYPSWYIHKEYSAPLSKFSLPQKLVDLGKMEDIRITRQRAFARYRRIIVFLLEKVGLKSIVKKILSRNR